MSHDSGFRRNDHDSTHRPAQHRQRGSKASRAYEERLIRRHVEHEQTRKPVNEQEATS